MYPKNSRAEPGFLKDTRGSGLQDSPFMILLAVLVIVFVTALGTGIAKSLMDLQQHANAVDAAEKIYDAADLLSAGAGGSSRTLWVNIPAGYEISCDGNLSLKDGKGTIGQPLKVDGITFEPATLQGRNEKYHLKIEYASGDGSPTITVSEIA